MSAIITPENLDYYYRRLESDPMLMPPKRSTTLHTRLKIPERFKNEKERKEWEVEQIVRTKVGYQGMSGKMYFYYNFVEIKDETTGANTGGFIRPEYRIYQDQWFKKVEDVKKRHRGAVCIKARQKGFSTMEQADALHDCFHQPRAVVGMNSKTKDDSEKFVMDMKIMFSRLPPFLRQPVLSDTTVGYFFGEKSGVDITGIQSQFFCKAPTDNCYEGWTLYKMIVDEGGKTKNLLKILSFGREGLFQGRTFMVGCPLVFGTVGEMSANGQGIKSVWDNHNAYQYDQYFVPGWAGLYTDKYGNDDVVRGVKWIMQQREQAKGRGQEDYIQSLQAYPLTPEEAFMQFSGNARWDLSRILAHKSAVEQETETQSDFPKTGIFRQDRDGKPVFVPQQRNEKGEENPVKIWQMPEKNAAYLSGTDPVDVDNPLRSKEVSDFCTYWMKDPLRLDGDNVVARIKYRPNNIELAYEQTALCDEFFNDAKNNIEDNRGSRMIAWYKANGYLKNLAIFRKTSNLKQGYLYVTGFKRTERIIEIQDKETVGYIEESCEKIPDPDLLNELTDFNQKNKDCLDAFQALLLNRKDYIENSRKKKGYEQEENEKNKGSVPTYNRKMVGGKIVYVR